MCLFYSTPGYKLSSLDQYVVPDGKLGLNDMRELVKKWEAGPDRPEGDFNNDMEWTT